MKYFFDTEFIDDGRTIDLISIGMACEDGRELYMVSSQFDESKAGDFVRKHVLSQLGKNVRHSRDEIAHAILNFTIFDAPSRNPEFWAYFADYDWVALCQLYGTMLGLPQQFPHYCLDLRQTMHHLKVTNAPKQTSPEHHALNDARWVRDTYVWLGQTWQALI